MPESPAPAGTPESSPISLVRLNKAIADTGYCARRKADDLISAGKVQVNGQTVTEMGLKIDPQRDVITIGGQPLISAEKAYLLFHKPTGYVTSRRGGRQQKTIYELLPAQYQSVDPAGRLDQDSSGALLLSNDGDFLFKITHPRFHLSKLYEMTLDRPLSQDEMAQLQSGILLKPENKMARMFRLVQDEQHSCRYQAELITGYNRQIRRSLAAVGARVLTLHRLSFGSVALGDLNPGQTRALTSTEQAALLENLAPNAT